eukprot:m.9740 g.9740  ORF g.9740 m.9740 type:complete len:236 (+) comp3537_c0_seq1:206-913(+)
MDEGYRYGDTFVRAGDRRLMKPGRWLNDVCISFAIDYFQIEDEEVLHSISTTGDEQGSSKIYFMTPSSVQMVLFFESSDVEQVLLIPNGCAEHEKEYIFVPINDGVFAMQANAGSHWALLVYSIRDGSAYMFDSIASKPLQDLATNVANILHKAVGNIRHGASSVVSEINVDASQPYVTQTNSSDCGVYVIEAMRHIAVHGMSEINGFEHMTPSYIKNRRDFWFDKMERKLVKKK